MTFNQKLLFEEVREGVEQRMGPGSEQGVDLTAIGKQLLLQLCNCIGVRLLITEDHGLSIGNSLLGISENVVDLNNQLVVSG